MPRKKNYGASDARTAQVVIGELGAARPAPSLDDAYINMAALLGPEACFARNERVLDLRDWLGRGIDIWVCSAGFCLKAMLLSGAHRTCSVTTYFWNLGYLFQHLIGNPQSREFPRAQAPSNFLPLHVQHFIGWLQKLAQVKGWRPISIRGAFKAVKAVLVEMFNQGLIPGERSRYFPRGAVSWRVGESRQTSLSEGEQEQLAKAIKSDLVAIHRNRLTLTQGAVQGLRLLLVAHRQGFNPTPLLEMRRDTLAPGFLPGTIRIRTAKHRNKKIRSSAGRAAQVEQSSEQDLVFDLSEGAVLQQAIASTRDLVAEAPAAIKQRVWLYRTTVANGTTVKGGVTCISTSTLETLIHGLIERHQLLGDDGKPLRLNLSRLRKSMFDRALRVSDRDLAVTANLMGNTPRVAGMHYPSMNDARVADAAGFMNADYTPMMRAGSGGKVKIEIRPVAGLPFKAATDGSPIELPRQTPVSRCKDTINGEHAPHDGRSHCDRYVMCLFCSSFAIVGTVDDLWRLFSFQAFARSELDYLDETLGAERTADDALEDLRDHYRVAIPFIDDFTRRQFAHSRVAQARAKAEAGLHPYWHHQMTMSRRARSREPDRQRNAPRLHDDTRTRDGFGT